MDELFLLFAESKVAMPRAYWLEDKLCAAVMLASPSEFEFGRIQARLRESQPGEYDMEIINALYGDSCLVFPHKPYLLTGEMRAKSHEAYLGSKDELWDVDSVMEQAKYIHFSDYPLAKPWVGAIEAMKSELMPSCKALPGNEAGGLDCADRNAWLWLYKEFRDRRKRVCGPEFADFERVEQHLADLPPMAKGLAQASG